MTEYAEELKKREDLNFCQWFDFFYFRFENQKNGKLLNEKLQQLEREKTENFSPENPTRFTNRPWQECFKKSFF
mgnify:CR=1 FL=1